MTPEGSMNDIDLRSLESISNNGLFPNIFSKKSDTLDQRTDEDARSSISGLRRMFKREDSRNREGQDITEQAGVFKSHFDTDSESSFEFDEDVSLEDSVIKEVSSKYYRGSIDESDRFKYLRAYEKAKQERSQRAGARRNSDAESSVFDLSDMNDFSRYVRQTSLNDRIQSEVMKRRMSLDSLKSVNESELVYNFCAEDPFKEEIPKVPKPKASWMTDRRKLEKEMKEQKDHKETYADDLSYMSTAGKKKRKNFLARKLKVRHLQMISFGGTLGVGLILNAGKAFTIAGHFGTLLAFTICGLIVLATIVSFSEMVTFVSVVDGVSGLSSRFVDDSFGFAIGWLYFFSFAFGLASEVVASVIMLDYYPSLSISSHTSASCGFVTLFLVSILVVNLLDVRIFGEVEYISSIIKLLFMLVLIIVMISITAGGFNKEAVGFKYWQYSKSDFRENIIFGLFRPTFNLQDNGTSPISEGVGGDRGRFMSLLAALLVTSYAYSGTEIVCIAACEAQNPRKALPSATKRVFWRILIFYVLSAFVLSLNLYAGDPRLLRYYSGSTGVSADQFGTNAAVRYVGGANCLDSSQIFAGFGNGSQSPWIVALSSTGFCNFASCANGFFVFFAVSCGNAQLYVSSRTLYSLALQKKAPSFLAKCNNNGIPYNAVLVSASFGLFAYLCASEAAISIFQNLTSLVASSGIMVWTAMCLSFIRFFYGLKKRPDIINREDPAYPYRSPFQPYTAIFGLVGSTIIILCMGFVVFLPGQWDVMFFFSSYGTIFLFIILYFGYKFIKGTRIPSLDILDFDAGRREMDRYIWDGGRDYNVKSFKDLTHRLLSFLA